MSFTNRYFVARVLGVTTGEIKEILELSQSEFVDDQEVDFSGSCELTSGKVVNFRGHYDGSWDHISNVSSEPRVEAIHGT